MLIKDNNTNRFKKKEQFDAGLLAVKGNRVAEIAVEMDVSRQFVYEQKRKLEEQIEELGGSITENNVKVMTVDDSWLERAVILLSLDCSSSLEGIQGFLEKIAGIHISIGKISGILKEACGRAESFDRTVPLSGIKVGANDEIFQCGKPVLTGIDPKTTYIYLMKATESRTGEAWEAALSAAKEAGLSLEKSVNDGGGGLKSGLPAAFPGIKIQDDVFHAQHDIGKAVGAMERWAMNRIQEEAVLELKLDGGKARKGTWGRWLRARDAAREAVGAYDLMYILYAWLRELLEITGYGIDETKALLTYILDEMEPLCSHKSFQKGARFIRGHMDGLLLYARLIEEQTYALAQGGVPGKVCGIMLEQLHYDCSSTEYNRMEAEIGATLGGDYSEVRGQFHEILEDAVRASSMVENINGRLRIYMNLKRTIPSKFLSLLKVYFNTKKYRRSRCAERVGKSPLDLLTGKDNPGLLELLGY